MPIFTADLALTAQALRAQALVAPDGITLATAGVVVAAAALVALWPRRRAARLAYGGQAARAAL